MKSIFTSAAWKPLPADGGPQLAACRTYLQSIRNRDPAALRGLFAHDSKYDFATVDWQLWQRVRPMQLESWTGFVHGDDATLTLSGLSDASRLVPVQYLFRVFRWGLSWMNGVVPLWAGFMSAEGDLFELGLADADARRVVLLELNGGHF